MKSKHSILKSFTSEWKIAAILALTIFIAGMWYGISHHYEDIWLYAVAMLLASGAVAGGLLNVVLKWQEWRDSRGKPDA